jgi:hypothetical protein
MLDGELRRWTVSVRNPLAENYYQQGKHSHKIAQADDSGFPDYHRQGTPQPSITGAMDKIRRETAFLAGRPDIPVALVTVPPLRSFVSHILQLDRIVEENAHATPDVDPGSFQEALKQEFSISLDQRLSRGLAGGPIYRVQDQIRE